MISAADSYSLSISYPIAAISYNSVQVIKRNSNHVNATNHCRRHNTSVDPFLVYLIISPQHIGMDNRPIADAGVRHLFPAPQPSSPGDVEGNLYSSVASNGVIFVRPYPKR